MTQTPKSEVKTEEKMDVDEPSPAEQDPEYLKQALEAMDAGGSTEGASDNPDDSSQKSDGKSGSKKK